MKELTTQDGTSGPFPSLTQNVMNPSGAVYVSPSTSIFDVCNKVLSLICAGLGADSRPEIISTSGNPFSSDSVGRLDVSNRGEEAAEAYRDEALDERLRFGED